MFKNNLKKIRNIIYGLKKQYGVPIKYYRPIGNVIDVVEHTTVRTYSMQSIKKCVLLNTKDLMVFAYDLAYIAAAKNFTYGGHYNEKSRLIILDGSDFTTGFEPATHDHIQYDGKAWNVKEFSVVGEYQAWSMIVESTGNDLVPDEQVVSHNLIISDSSSNTVE